VHARERRPHLLERRRIALDRLQILTPRLEHAPHRADQQPLLERDHVVERGERPLGLHHPELDQVPARLALLRPERGPEAVHAPNAIAAASL
jgi:hypothetical protein